MTERYYISSTKYSIRERQTKKNGRVYDVYFRVVDINTREEKQKKLSGYKTKAAAKEAYTAFVTEKCELRKGEVVRGKQIRGLTVGELVDGYFATLKTQNKESTLYDKKSVFQNYILPRYANKPSTVFTKAELYRFQDELWNQKKENGEYISYAQAEKVRAYLSAFLDWCESRHDLPNHMREVKKPKRRKPKIEMQIWTREEFETFIQFVPDKKYSDLFNFLFFTGRRIGEALALSPRDVDLANKMVKVNKSLTRKTNTEEVFKITSTKAEKSQTIPICQPIVDILKTHESGDSFYFQSSQFPFAAPAPLSNSAVTYQFKQAIKKSGVKEIRIHDLRHSFVSMLIHLGANYNVIADLIGDTVDQVLKTYGHLYQTDKLSVISKIH